MSGISKIFGGLNDTLLLKWVTEKGHGAVDGLLRGDAFMGKYGKISQSGLDAATWAAASSGDTFMAHTVMTYGGSPQSERNGRLGSFAKAGFCDGIEMVLAEGADIHSEKEYALRMAILHNRPLAVGLLCSKGADIAVASRQEDVAKKLQTGGPEYEDMRGFVRKKLAEMQDISQHPGPQAE